MKNGFTAEKDLSQVSPQTSEPELTPRQNKIYRNLQDIGPEIAAFYLDGVKMLRSDNFETAPYLLAHITREIDGGLRDILSSDEDKTKIQKQLTKEVLAKIGDYSTLKKYKGHIASILVALGIDNIDVLSNLDDASIRFAVRWIEVTGNFSKFAHRHGPWKAPRSREAFEHLWYDFEEVLADLVGSYLNLLNRLDRILTYKAPTKEIIETLPNLLDSDARRAYFFRELKYPTWLKPLREAGWFDPEKNPLPYETSDGYYRTPVWYALEYLEKVAQQPECSVDLLVDIVNTIIDYINNTRQRIENYNTNYRLIQIIDTFPTERLERQHIIFMGQASRWAHPVLMEKKIGQTLLPKLLNGGAEELTLVLLKVVLNDKISDGEMISVMEEQGAAIVKLCGVKAANIALKRIRDIIAADASAFVMIQTIEPHISQDSYQSYDERLVRFTNSLFRLAESDSIAETVEVLLKESHTIIRRIALNAVMHHYSELKSLFWEWQGNPLEKDELKPELYQLIQTHCLDFDDGEIEQILYWIESCKYSVAKDGQEHAKDVALYKRKWLTALLKTSNEKVITAYQHYERINPAKIKHPGLLWWTEAWTGEPSPKTIEELSDMSNAQIARFLNSFKKKGISGPSVPTEEGLAETLEECVGANPQRFANDLQPFQGIRTFYQYRILRGFLQAWRDKKEFDWAKLLEFIHQIVSSKRFWTEQHEIRYDHNHWIFGAAELIESGTRDDTHAFDPQLLPLAEKILMVCVDETEPIMSTLKDLPSAVLNSARGSVFSAMVTYVLRYARINNPKQEIGWPQAIREDFTKRLDRSIESSFEFSFTLGNYLPNLLYLDKEWVVDNIDRIFPQQDEYHWHVAFSGYLLYSRQLYEIIYSLFKKHGHYQRALTSDFCNQQVDATVLPETPVVYLDSQQMDLTVDRRVRETLVSDICVGWMEGWETLEDKTSLIYQLINSGKPKLLSTLIHFFWRQRGNLPSKAKAKVMPTWRALFEVLSQQSDIVEYQEVLSRLSGWVDLVDKIDEEVLQWLKLSARHIKRLSDSAFFIEALRAHVPQTPKEVSVIYLEMLNNNIYPDYNPTDIQEIVRILYNQGHKEAADEICNLYAKAGREFLKPLWEEYQN